MIKTKQHKIEYSYLLNQEEGELFKNCLQYVRHRILKHPECGAKVIGLGNVARLLSEFDNEVKREDNLIRKSCDDICDGDTSYHEWNRNHGDGKCFCDLK